MIEIRLGGMRHNPCAPHSTPLDRHEQRKSLHGGWYEHQAQHVSSPCSPIRGFADNAVSLRATVQVLTVTAPGGSLDALLSFAVA